MMERLRAAVRDRLVTGAVVSFVAAFIGIDLLDSSGRDWRGWLSALRGQLLPPAVETTEIRDYVEFITVSHNGIEVVTGVRYGSSYSRTIVAQWCYAERSEAGIGRPEFKLTLANKFGESAIITNSFTDANLKPFGITAPEARSLVENHCRFRT